MVGALVRQTFEAVVMCSLFPRSQIDIIIQVLQSDGGMHQPSLLFIELITIRFWLKERKREEKRRGKRREREKREERWALHWTSLSGVGGSDWGVPSFLLSHIMIMIMVYVCICYINRATTTLQGQWGAR